MVACTSVEKPEIIPAAPKLEVTAEEIPVAPTEIVVSEPQTPESCLALGCLRGTNVVGDVKSDIFYECNCTFAKWIKPEDMLCFTSASAAMESGYRQAESC